MLQLEFLHIVLMIFMINDKITKGFSGVMSYF